MTDYLFFVTSLCISLHTLRVKPIKDLDRLDLARAELHSLLQSEDLANACILLFANKQDLNKAASAAEISEALSLHTIQDHGWHIQACCALTGEGLYAGMDWLTSRLKDVSS